MRKILLSLMALFALTVSAETRSWDFTQGDTYKDLASDANFTLLSKGRYSNTNALTEESFVLSDGSEFAMSAGLKFTCAEQKIMFGLTANYFFQSNGDVSMIIPNVTKGDTIVVDWCSGSKGATKTLSGNIEPTLSTSSTSKETSETYATADGDLAISMASTTRIYSITVKPYVAAAEGECKAPIVKVVGVDPVAKAWLYEIKAGEEGETLSYATDEGASMALLNEIDTIAVKPGITITVNAVKGDNSNKTTFTAAEFVKSEKVPTTEPKSTEIVGTAYTINALDNAGAGNGYNVKWRANQEGNTMTINVKEGFALTNVVIKGKNNFTTGDITLKSFCVDGGESLSGNEFAVFNAAQDEQTITFSGVAKKSIILTFGDTQGTATQFNADVNIDWAFADEVQEAENKVEFAYLPADTSVYTVKPIISISYLKSGKTAELDNQEIKVAKLSDGTYTAKIPYASVTQETNTLGTVTMSLAETEIKNIVMTPSAENADSLLISLKEGAEQQILSYNANIYSVDFPGTANIESVTGYQYNDKLYLAVNSNFTVSMPNATLGTVTVSGSMSVQYNPENAAPVLAVADFEDITLDGTEAVKYFEGAAPSTDWKSGDYTFSTYTADYGDYGKYYYSYAVSNKTVNTAKLSDYALASACGGAKSGSNYAVWYDNSYNGGDSVVLSQPSIVNGVYVTNTSSVVDAILNGDGMSVEKDGEMGKPFGYDNEDNYTVIFTGYNKAGEKQGEKKFRLAYVTNKVIYYAKNWMWVDLSALGTISYIKVSVSSSKANAWGSTTPSYVCFDDFGAAKPDVMADYETESTAVKTVNAANANVAAGKFIKNGQVIILKNGKQYNAAGAQMK